MMPGDRTTANFLTTWQGSTVDTRLIDPTGRVITPIIVDQDLLIAHQKGLTYELYRITDPQPGSWQVSIYGADLPAGGEEVSVQVAVRAPQTSSGRAYLPLVLAHTPFTPPISPTPMATPSLMPSLSCPVAPVGLALDGYLAEWSGRPALQVDQATANYSLRTPRPSVTDLAGGVSCAWQDNDLIFAAVVTDDVLKQDEREYLG